MKGINQKKIFAITLAGFGLVAVSSALAVPSLPMGWYIEGNIGIPRTTNVSYTTTGSVSRTDGNWGVNVNVGYKFLPYFATEIGYTRYAQSTAKSGGVKVAKASFYSYDLAGKAMLPMYDSGFEFYGKLGIARVNTNISQSNTVPGVIVNTGSKTVTGAYLALGGAYSWTANFSTHVEWARAQGKNNGTTLDLFSLGLAYLF